MTDEIKKFKSKDEEGWYALDLFSTLDIDRNPTLTLLKSSERFRFIFMLWELMQLPILLISIGIITSLSSVLMNNLRTALDYRLLIPTQEPSLYNFILYFLFCTSCAILSMVVCELICPDAEGGGPSEMKAILSGTIKKDLLSGKYSYGYSGSGSSGVV